MPIGTAWYIFGFCFFLAFYCVRRQYLHHLALLGRRRPHFFHVQTHLQRGGWRSNLRDAEYMTNQADSNFSWPSNSNDGGTLMHRSELRALGVTITPDGFTHRDLSKKLYAVEGQINERQALWKVKASTGVQRCALLQRLAQSILSWAAPAWRLGP